MLKLVVEGHCGDSKELLCAEAQQLADRILVVVEFDFNGCTCMAFPGGSAEKLSERIAKAMGNPNTWARVAVS